MSEGSLERSSSVNEDTKSKKRRSSASAIWRTFSKFIHGNFMILLFWVVIFNLNVQEINFEFYCSWSDASKDLQIWKHASNKLSQLGVSGKSAKKVFKKAAFAVAVRN